MHPRLTPDRPLPPYAHVPGRTPHPISDERGHSFGQRPAPGEPLDPQRWRECRDYLYGIDLFNHGYYWEAHEVWEGLWHACGRSGPTADFLKGLIKLAAAGVKVREGQAAGVVTHATRAAELFQRVTADHFLGLRIADLLDDCRRAAATAVDTNPDATIVFDFVLRPEEAPP